jgi:hypothetical protein
MLIENLSVRNIRGRYPAFGSLKPENLIADVKPIGQLIVIRIDDEEHPDAWFEITVELHQDALRDDYAPAPPVDLTT